jgi:hypothetical protein
MSKIFVGIALAVATIGAGFSASPSRIRRSRVQRFALTSFMSSMSVIPRALTTLITGVLKSEVQHPDSYKVLPWKNNINNSSLKSG